MRRKVAAGNWKMNGLRADLAELAQLAALPSADCDIILCPPATLIAGMAAKSGTVRIGAQDCAVPPSGAFTGDLSAEILADAGASAIIVGHSERRALHGESSQLVCLKAQAVHRAGLTAIICIGETLAERDAGQALKVTGDQLAASVPGEATPANTIIAYEPVWAIGTGRTASLSDIAEMHAFLRAQLTLRFGAASAEALRILYGGSVKPANASEIFATANVDGGLVGGASMKAADFAAIIAAAAI